MKKGYKHGCALKLDGKNTPERNRPFMQLRDFEAALGDSLSFMQTRMRRLSIDY